MAKKGNPENQNQGGGSVAKIPERCPVEKCGKKVVRSAFCEEHFVWFKEGLVNRKGEKPKDFDKKYQAYVRRQHKAA
ncbi:MAG: hypothetical protein H6624_04200 [Bdellovibrionaceae bacterium]|nr:hypothetical protein [Bdellovibrionales bacterium]MCB9083517.1 hypothetical protein [Pseudobdellovibrionaceae bacterium]